MDPCPNGTLVTLAEDYSVRNNITIKNILQKCVLPNVEIGATFYIVLGVTLGLFIILISICIICSRKSNQVTPETN